MTLFKTQNYEMFKLRPDNREIKKNHLQRLITSIQMRNLLEYRPIVVNEKMEVIDGQHRLEAAKYLKTDIYYSIAKDIKSEEMINLNVAKSWTLDDYFNFYVENGKKDYLELRRYIQNNSLSLSRALALVIGKSRKGLQGFREGLFTFNEHGSNIEITICKDTLEYISKYTTGAYFMNSTKFWKALLSLIKQPEFDLAQWKRNLEKLVSRISPRVSEKDYLELFLDIYNYRSKSPISLKMIEKSECDT